MIRENLKNQGIFFEEIFKTEMAFRLTFNFLKKDFLKKFEKNYKVFQYSSDI